MCEWIEYTWWRHFVSRTQQGPIVKRRSGSQVLEEFCSHCIEAEQHRALPLRQSKQNGNIKYFIY